MRRNLSFPSSDGKTTIHAVCWEPTGKPIAILQLVHGMVEYIERYDEFAGYMVSQGFLVVGHDHLGHGDSVTTLDKRGYIAEGDHPESFMIKDIHRLRIGTQKKYPGLPYYILGHSMGSYLLRMYLTAHGEGLTGAIICGTGSIPDPATTLGLTICESLAKKHGWFYRSTFVQKLSYAGPYRKFDLYGEDPERSWLTKDTEIVKKYYENEKCTFVFTLNAYKALFHTVYFDNQPENIRKIPKKLPLLLVSGEDDPVGDMGKGVKRVYQQLVQAGIQDVVCRLFENDRHELLNETDRTDVYAYLRDWLLEHI